MEYGTVHHGNVGEVYWKILKHNNYYTVACLQDFDEYDYDQSLFVRNSDDKIHVFETEEMAIIKINKWFKPEDIDPEHRLGDTIRD